MSELVDDLERHGIVERRPDPSDGRAKLICLTDSGWVAMRTARRVIAEIGSDYSAHVGADRFEAGVLTFSERLDALIAEKDEVPGSRRDVAPRDRVTASGLPSGGFKVPGSRPRTTGRCCPRRSR